MNGDDWRTALDELRESCVDVEARANRVSVQLPDLCRIQESLKVGVLKSKLEKQRRHAARVQAVAAIKQDRSKLSTSLALGVAGLVLGGALGEDGYSALRAGLGALDASLQRFGESSWAVSLDRAMLVVPRDQITAVRFWVTWESLNEAMGELMERALAGEKLGDLGTIVSKLKQDRQVHRYLLPSPTRQADSRK